MLWPKPQTLSQLLSPSSLLLVGSKIEVALDMSETSKYGEAEHHLGIKSCYLMLHVS